MESVFTDGVHVEDSRKSWTLYRVMGDCMPAGMMIMGGLESVVLGRLEGGFFEGGLDVKIV